MTKRNHEGDLADILREAVREAGKALGLGQNVCNDLALAAEDRLRLRASGTPGYVGRVDRRRRNAEIRMKYNGHNEKDIAREFGLSLRRVQQILSDSANRSACTAGK